MDNITFKQETTILKANNIQQLCRVCFQSIPNLISCCTKLIVADTSCTIAEILNLLSPQQINFDPASYPTGICPSCKELVNTTAVLKIKYEKTSDVLKTWFFGTKISNEDEKIEENINDYNDDNDNMYDCGLYDDKEQLKISPTVSIKEQINFEINTNKPKQIKSEPLAKKQTFYSLAETNFCHMCPVCMVNLSSPLEVRKHALNHRTLKKYLKRKKYKAKFYSMPRETQTIFSNATILHQCVHCWKELTVENFRDHIIEHNKGTEFPCKKCGRIFRRQNHLNSHITYSHLEEFPFQCEFCDKKFVIKENYSAHLLIHTKPEVLPYNCDKCNQSFVNKKHLYYHSFKHTELGSFSAKYKTHRCKICLRTFENAVELQEHRVQSHERRRNKIELTINSDGLFQCKLCPKTFHQAIALKQHIRKTHGPKNLCSLCGASVLNLKQHMLSHAEKRDPLECHICHRLLASKLTLSRHIRVHTGEKPYKCSYCDKTFKDHYPMRVHERIHKGIKKHICSVCGKGFLEKSYMLKHLRAVHSK